MADHIFISHSSKNDDTVKKLRERLELAGLTTWVDSREFTGGDMLDATLTDKIKTAKTVIALLSIEALSSAWVQRELKLAQEVAEERRADGYKVISLILPGVPAGLLAATSRHRWLDGIIRVVSLVGLSIPGFWLGITLILIFAVNLRWFAVTGDEGLKALILPALALGLVEAATLARLARTSALEVISQDFVLVARAKGLSRRRMNWHHILRNALIPIITVLGLRAGALLGGAVFIEAVFARPGIGRFAVNAITNRDLPQIQGVVLFVAVTYVLLNLGVDILYGLIDPRIGQDALG